MNKFSLQILKPYPLARYIIKYEREYYNKFSPYESTAVYKRVYKSSEIVSERVVDYRYVLRNSVGKFLCYYF